jgi:hypothetical protein
VVPRPPRTPASHRRAAILFPSSRNGEHPLVRQSPVLDIIQQHTPKQQRTTFSMCCIASRCHMHRTRFGPGPAVQARRPVQARLRPLLPR